MEIELIRTDNLFQMQAASRGFTTDVTAIPALAGESAQGLRPMELILTALGSCMSIDVLSILYKQRQKVDSFKVSVSGNRSEGVPSVFTTIEISIIVSGSVTKKSLAKAIQLSEETYCSVHHMLNSTVDITTKYLIEDGE